MTRDELSTRGGDPQRVVDALGDLFDSVSPSERAAAEEELRDSGLDPGLVGQRCTEVVARALGESAASVDRSHRAARRYPGRLAQRAAAEHSATYVPRRSRGEIARAVAVLLVGIAIGWLLTRGEPPAPPHVRVARPDRPATATGEWPAVTGKGASDGSRVARGPGVRADEDSSKDASARQREVGPPTAEVGHHSAAGNERPGAASEPAAGDLAANAEPAAPIEPEAHNGGEGTLADLPDRWVLDQNDWQRAEDLLPGPILQHVKTGEYWFTVQSIPAETFTSIYSDGFWADSRANAGRYDVDGSTCGLKEAVGGATPASSTGLPFPTIAATDPSAGCKIMWNASAATAVVGPQEATLSLDQLAAGTSGAAHRLLVRLYSLTLQGKQPALTADSHPLRSTSLLSVTAPPDVAGTAYLTQRSDHPAARDLVWAFVPALRRLRRVNSANRSDGLLGSDLSLDQLDCFDAKLEDFQWRLLGRQTVLAPLTTVQSIERTALSATRAAVAVPSPKAAFEVEGSVGAPWLLVEGLVMTPRPVWVVEGVPRDKYYLYGKLVLYVDTEVYRPYWQLAYGWNGEYVAHAMCAQHWSRSADGDSAGATAGTVMAVNEALRRATLMRYRSQVIDQELDRDFFTAAKMIDLSR